MRTEDIQKARQLSKQLASFGMVPSVPKKVKPSDLSFVKKLTGFEPKTRTEKFVGKYVPYEKPKPDTAEQIVEKINTLEGAIEAKAITGLLTAADVVDEIKNLKGNDKIDISHIRNGENLARLAAKNADMNDMRWHGGGLSSVSHDATLTGNGTASSPLSVVGSATTFYTDTISGVINSSNVTFTVPHAITSMMNLFLAGMPYQSGVDFTFSGTTITFITAPDSSLSGQPFFCTHT